MGCTCKLGVGLLFKPELVRDPNTHSDTRSPHTPRPTYISIHIHGGCSVTRLGPASSSWAFFSFFNSLSLGLVGDSVICQWLGGWAMGIRGNRSMSLASHNMDGHNTCAPTVIVYAPWRKGFLSDVLWGFGIRPRSPDPVCVDFWFNLQGGTSAVGQPHFLIWLYTCLASLPSMLLSNIF